MTDSVRNILKQYRKNEIRDAVAYITGLLAAHDMKERLRNATKKQAVDQAAMVARNAARARTLGVRDPIKKEHWAKILVRRKRRARELGLLPKRGRKAGEA